MRAILLAAGLVAALTGCISDAPTQPVTPANQQQVATCQSIASWHNGAVIGDFVVGGSSAALAGVGAAVTDSTTKNDLAIGAAVAAGLGVVGAGISGFTAADFTNSQCSSVVGPLPAGGQKQ